MAATVALNLLVLVLEDICPRMASATAATIRASVGSCGALDPGAAGSGAAVSLAGAAAAARSSAAFARAFVFSALSAVSQVCFFRLGASCDTSCVWSSGLSWAVCVRPKGRVTEHDQWATATGLSLDGLYCYL